MKQKVTIAEHLIWGGRREGAKTSDSSRIYSAQAGGERGAGHLLDAGGGGGGGGGAGYRRTNWGPTSRAD